MKEIKYKVVEHLGYDTTDKKQKVIGEITKNGIALVKKMPFAAQLISMFLDNGIS